MTDVAVAKKLFRRLLERLLKALWKGRTEQKILKNGIPIFTKQTTMLMSEK